MIEKLPLQTEKSENESWLPETFNDVTPIKLIKQEEGGQTYTNFCIKKFLQRNEVFVKVKDEVTIVAAHSLC